MEALLQQLIFMGWEVKRGKHIALRKPDQKRFKRMDSLGEDYTQEALVSIMQGNQPHAPKRKKSMNKKQEHRMALLADTQRACYLALWGSLGPAGREAVWIT